MAGAQSPALKHWARIIQRWPVDKVRPDNVAFPKLMRQRLEKYSSPASSDASVSAVKSKDGLVTADTPRTWDEPKEMQQVNVLYSLLENRYSKATPMPASLRNPQSNPMHYDDLLTEMQEAPARSWLGGVIKRLKGSFRLT